LVYYYLFILFIVLYIIVPTRYTQPIKQVQVIEQKNVIIT